MKNMVKLFNDFHNTEVSLRLPKNGILSEAQKKKAHKTLCGIVGCTCGGELGIRGPQDVKVNYLCGRDSVRVQIVEKE